MDTIKTCWPDTKQSLPAVLLPYFSYWDELTVQDGNVLRGDRVVIQLSLRNDMKQKVHAGHLGINTCLRRARDLIFWPAMSRDIRQYVESCETCHQHVQTKPRACSSARDTSQTVAKDWY